MSNKTEILGFEDSWKKNRHVFESTKSLAKVMYLDGQQSKQDEVDELQKRIDEAWIWCEKGCILKAMAILKGEETK